MKHTRRLFELITSGGGLGTMLRGAITKDNLTWLAGLTLTIVMIAYYINNWNKKPD